MSDAVSLPTKHELKLLTFRAIVAYAVRASLRVEPLYHSDNPAHEEAVKAANQIALEFVGTAGADDDDAKSDDAKSDDAKSDGVKSDGAKSDARFDDDAYAADRAAYAAARADVGSAAADAAARAAYAADRAADAAAYARFADTARAVAATTRAADAAAAAADAALRAAADDDGKDADACRADAIAACRQDYEKLLELSRDTAGELGQPFDVKSENGPLGPLWSNGQPASFLNAGKLRAARR